MPDSKPKKVIVFGGAGFLGGYVVEELNKRGHQVTVFDRNAPVGIKNGFEVIEGDIMDGPPSPGRMRSITLPASPISTIPSTGRWRR